MLADIFRRAPDLESFRRAVVALNGDFAFDCDSLVRLGQAYLERYPDRLQNRNLDEVRVGYTLARICLVERLLRPVAETRRDLFRRLLIDTGAQQNCLEELLGVTPRENLSREFRLISAELTASRQVLEDMPRGMVKERFMGGLSSLYSILYLLKTHLERSQG